MDCLFPDCSEFTWSHYQGGKDYIFCREHSLMWEGFKAAQKFQGIETNRTEFVKRTKAITT